MGRAGRSDQAHSSPLYLTTLLEKLQRDLTLKEVVQQFYKNPAFPLLGSTEEVRRAIFESLKVGYELVSGDGTSLQVATQNERVLGSIALISRECVHCLGTGASGVPRRNQASKLLGVVIRTTPLFDLLIGRESESPRGRHFESGEQERRT